MEVVECVECGCTGNGSCGHGPMNEEVCCTLNKGICGCCILMRENKVEAENDKKTI